METITNDDEIDLQAAIWESLTEQARSTASLPTKNTRESLPMTRSQVSSLPVFQTHQDLQSSASHSMMGFTANLPVVVGSVQTSDKRPEIPLEDVSSSTIAKKGSRKKIKTVQGRPLDLTPSTFVSGMPVSSGPPIQTRSSAFPFASTLGIRSQIRTARRSQIATAHPASTRLTRRMTKSRFTLFMNLPAEIREIVYGYHFGHDTTIKPKYELDVTFKWVNKCIHVPLFKTIIPGTLQLERRSKNILLANKGVSEEAARYLYGGLRIFLEQDQADAFRIKFCPMVGQLNASRIKHLQMDIPNCLKVQPRLSIPEYASFITCVLPNLGELTLSTTFWLAVSQLRWMEEHRGMLHTAAAIVNAHQRLKYALWNERGTPRSMKKHEGRDSGPGHNPSRLLMPHDSQNKACIQVTLTDKAFTGLEGLKGSTDGLILDSKAIRDAGWEGLRQNFDPRRWAINTMTDNENAVMDDAEQKCGTGEKLISISELEGENSSTPGQSNHAQTYTITRMTIMSSTGGHQSDSTSAESLRTLPKALTPVTISNDDFADALKYEEDDVVIDISPDAVSLIPSFPNHIFPQSASFSDRSNLVLPAYSGDPSASRVAARSLDNDPDNTLIDLTLEEGDNDQQPSE